MPGELKPMFKTRSKEERLSDSAYARSCIFFDILCRRPHKVTGPLMREPQWIQDAVVAEIVKDYDKPGTPLLRSLRAIQDGKEHEDTTWLGARLKELVEDAKQGKLSL